MNDTATSRPKIPAHVPEHLILQFSEEDDPTFTKDPFGVYRRLADIAPPIFFTPRDVRSANGNWIVTNADYAREILQNPDPFSTTVRYGSDDATFARRLVPLMMDPPEHIQYRSIIAPLFAPQAIDRLEKQIYQVANTCLDGVAKSGQTDFMHSFARVFPGTVFMTVMGMPLDMKEQFFLWEEKFFHDGTNDEKRQVGQEIAHYMAGLIEERRRKPADDIITALTKAKVNGKPIDDAIVHDFCFLLYIAGLDTVNGGLGHIWKYMAEHPEAQAALRANPALIPDAVEEMLRFHSWISVSRVLVRDQEFHGVPMKEGDRVVILAPLVSRDPEQFSKPHEVDLARTPNPHFAFGAGVHRCAGSHLARREMRIGLQEWLRRIPEWRIKEGETPPYFIDGLLSLRNLPLTWDGAKAI